MEKCYVCGAECADAAVFCGNCGAKLGAGNSERPTDPLAAAGPAPVDAARQAGLYEVQGAGREVPPAQPAATESPDAGEVPCKGLKTAAFVFLLLNIAWFTLQFIALFTQDQAYSMLIIRYAVIVPIAVHAWGVRTGEHELTAGFTALALLLGDTVAGLLYAIALLTARNAGKGAA